MALAIEERLSLVLASFREEVSVADLCRKAQVPESTFRDWRDRFIAAGTAAFEDRTAKGDPAGAPDEPEAPEETYMDPL